MAKITAQGMLKGAMYTGLALIVLGFVKQSAPDIWSKIPGLNQF